MKTTFPVLALVLALSACSSVLADNSKIIALNSSEKGKSMAILERRQAIYLKREKLDAQYKSDVNRLDEETTSVNIDASQLCFELKKSHSIPPNVQYQLDEVNARLVKQ
jgi:hypothetical protein